MQIQTTETDFIEVQVMVVENFLISNIFLEKKNAAQAIKVRNASYSLSAIIFYTNRHKVFIKHGDGVFNVKGHFVFSGKVKLPGQGTQSVKKFSFV